MDTETVPLSDTIMTFGKYSGKPYHVLVADAKYVKWLICKMDVRFVPSKLVEYLTECGFKTKAEQKERNAMEDSHIITSGKYSGYRYDELPNQYCAWLISTFTQETTKQEGLYEYCIARCQ
jgi:uncharacterized protein (DUF3820 family)